jgi:hypothetical protein
VAIRTSPDGRLSALAAEALLLTFGLRIAPANALVAESFAPESVELRVLVVADPTFGPLLGLGVGGRLGELVDEVAFRVTPLTDRDARELVRAGPARRWIEGRCGREQPADTEALEELLLRVSLLAESVPELTELVLDPLVVLPRPRGCAIGQASVRAGAPHDAHPFRYVSAAALAHPPRA